MSLTNCVARCCISEIEPHSELQQCNSRLHLEVSTRDTHEVDDAGYKRAGTISGVTTRFLHHLHVAAREHAMRHVRDVDTGLLSSVRPTLLHRASSVLPAVVNDQSSTPTVPQQPIVSAPYRIDQQRSVVTDRHTHRQINMTERAARRRQCALGCIVGSIGDTRWNHRRARITIDQRVTQSSTTGINRQYTNLITLRYRRVIAWVDHSRCDRMCSRTLNR